MSKETIKALPWFGLGKLIPFLKPYKKYVIIMICCGLMESVVDIVLPLFQKYALDHFVTGGTMDTVLGFVSLYVGVLLTMGICGFISTYCTSFVELYTAMDMRQAAFSHLQTLSFSYFNQNSVGYIHARIMSDTSRIGSLLSWSMMDGVWHLSYLIGAIAVMLSIHWKLALVVLILVPITAYLVSVFQRKLVGYHRRIREINSRITGNFNEGIVGAKTIKTLVVEDKIAADFKKDTGDMKRTTVRQAHIRGLFFSTTTFASSLALALVLWQGGLITREGVMLIGTLSMFMSYAQGMMEPIRWVVDAFSSLITAQVNIERLSGLLETESDVADRPEVIAKYGDTFHPKKENWEELSGDIEFKDVSFRYPDGEEYILEHFDLLIPKGSNVAIVGETGAGKSTLVNLVCRFFEPTDGVVLIDGRDARERSQLWLHSHIGYVLQSPHLFSGSVRDNLRYGKPDATDEEIWTALRRVSAEGVVERMEKGLDSEVGEGGDLLSTGEKQLLSFARAILADPRILVLDEATASIDTLTEAKIQYAIGEVIAGRTSLMIAHRLSTVRHADMILVVEDGKIIERGTHTELLKLKGKYYTLYNRQFEEESIDRIIR
ncbi:MAG: ABC transporter ATP-binding protein [Clostridia bacterium]|nr:ABC transporter ATP-binding protein [Clostridia bacterium]